MTSSIEELIGIVEKHLSKANDVGQVFGPFRTLVEAVLESREKKYIKVVEDLFGQIESGLKWKNTKDAEKVQRKLELYRIMIKLYQSETFENVEAAFECYNKIIHRSIVTFTSKNIAKYRHKFLDDFYDAGWKIAMKNPKLRLKLRTRFWDTARFVLDCFETQKLPKDLVLYDRVLGAIADHYTVIGNKKEALTIERERLATAVKSRSLVIEGSEIDYFHDLCNSYSRVIRLYNDLGQHKNCLKTCEVLLKIYKKLDVRSQASEFPTLVEMYIYTLHYQAMSLANIGSPGATKAISDLQAFMSNDPLAKVVSEEHLKNLSSQINPYVTGAVFHEDHNLKEISEKFEKGKAFFHQKKFAEAFEMFELASKTLPNIVSQTEFLILNLEMLFWLSRNDCCRGDHLGAVEGKLQCIEGLLKNGSYLRKMSVSLKVTLGDIYEELAICLLFHVGYNEEALDAFEKALKYPNKSYLFKNYALFLIGSNKLKKALYFMDNNRQALADDQAALIYYLTGNMEKTDEILLHSKNSSTLMNYIQVQRWQERGCAEWAIELYEKDMSWPINTITYSVMKLGIGKNDVFNYVILDIVDVIIYFGGGDGKINNVDVNDHFAIVDTFEKLTKACLENFSHKDSIKFHKYLVKSLKSETPAAKKMKKCQKELYSWSNSVSIALFIQKKLKQKKCCKEPFILFEKMLCSK